MKKIKQNTTTFYTIFASADLVVSCILLERVIQKSIFIRGQILEKVFCPNPLFLKVKLISNNYGYLK